MFVIGKYETTNGNDKRQWRKQRDVLKTTNLIVQINAVCFSGKVSLIGVLAGVVTKLPVTLVLMKHVSLQGILVGSRQMFINMNRAIEAN